ncbi:uncharacterized protein LOC122090846 [Macadamia integrifolia]|uniref:uncharacterized protein LOC122090846 n=1 Tax=Macadamia integrifolia TaxID=60698 RepID=UPI001C4FA59E|nr:uncharacterized protein LOC122090846 [Macadamia integrifolia]
MELLHETTSSASPPAPAPAPAASHGCPEYGAPVPWIGLYIAAATMKIKTPSMIDETRWILTKEVWLQWKNPNHWFRTKIDSPEYKSKESKNKVLKQAFHALGQKFGSLASKHKALVTTESLIISKFMAEAETNDDLDKKIDFLKKCFVEMIRFLLSKLPLAILKEIHGDDPTEIGEERMRKALKFLGKLELLSEVGDKIKWSWPDKLYLDAVGSAEGDDNA